MLTVAKLLKDPIFSRACVVAGENGLNQIVEWSHIIDVPEVVEMVGGGHKLIITTGQGLPHQPDLQTRFIADLAEAGLSGMIVSVGGKFFQELPQPFLDAANTYNFPLITLPRDVRFVDITRTIHEQLVSQHYTMLKQSDYIHKTLTNIVLQGGSLQELAEALAQLVNRAVTIEGAELNMLAYAGYGEIDRAREESIAGRETPPFLRQFIQEQGILAKLAESLQPAVLPAFPEKGMTKERIVAPIVVDRTVYGYLWLIAGDEPLTEADTMAIERAAMVAALLMFKETAVQQTEARLQADVISQLLSEQPHSLALTDKLNRLGLDLSQSQRVLLLRPPTGVIPSLRLANKLSPVVRQFTVKTILQPLGQNMILILPDQVDARQLGQALVAALPGIKIGVGETAPDLISLPQSYQQAKEALDVGLALANAADIYTFSELGFLHWLYNLSTPVRESNRYTARVKILATEEKAARAELLRTLETFADCGYNAAETARVLKIHRNTLAYRLKQIEMYCQVSLSDPVTLLNLQIAVKAFRLSH